MGVHMRCGAVRCGAARCGAVRCVSVRLRAGGQVARRNRLGLSDGYLEAAVASVISNALNMLAIIL